MLFWNVKGKENILLIEKRGVVTRLKSLSQNILYETKGQILTKYFEGFIALEGVEDLNLWKLYAGIYIIFLMC